MLLTKEKDSIYRIALENDKKNFPCIDNEKSSYYLKYSLSKHLDGVIMEYNSDFDVFRNNINNLWSDESNSLYKGDILSAMYKCKDNEENLMEAIDLFNYMM